MKKPQAAKCRKNIEMPKNRKPDSWKTMRKVGKSKNAEPTRKIKKSKSQKIREVEKFKPKSRKKPPLRAVFVRERKHNRGCAEADGNGVREHCPRPVGKLKMLEVPPQGDCLGHTATHVCGVVLYAYTKSRKSFSIEEKEVEMYRCTDVPKLRKIPRS